MGFGAGFILLAVVSLSIVWRTQKLQQETRWVERAHETIEELDDLMADQTRSQNELLQKHIRRLEQLAGGTPSLERDAALLRVLAAQQAAQQNSGATPASESGAVRRAVDAMKTEQHRLIDENRVAWDKSLLKGRLFSAAGLLLSLAFLGAASMRVSRDITRRATAEQKLAAKDEQYRQVVELAGDLIYRTDLEGRFTFCNQACLTLLHYTEEEVIGRSYLKLIRQDKRREAERFYLRQRVRVQKSTYLELPVLDGHGRTRWLGQNVQLVNEGGKPAGFQAIARDMTERKQAEFELQKSRNFIERIAATTPGILYVYDIWSGAACSAIGKSSRCSAIGRRSSAIWTA